MHPLSLSRILLFLLFVTTTSLAADGSVIISSPKEGATLDAMSENSITYAIVPGPKGDHSHLYVDGEEVGILRKLKGSYKLPTLAPGERTLCIKVVNKNHTPIGVEQCIKVRVE